MIDASDADFLTFKKMYFLALNTLVLKKDQKEFTKYYVSNIKEVIIKDTQCKYTKNKITGICTILEDDLIAIEIVKNPKYNLAYDCLHEILHSYAVLLPSFYHHQEKVVIDNITYQNYHGLIGIFDDQKNLTNQHYMGKLFNECAIDFLSANLLKTTYIYPKFAPIYQLIQTSFLNFPFLEKVFKDPVQILIKLKGFENIFASLDFCFLNYTKTFTINKDAIFENIEKIYNFFLSQKPDNLALKNFQKTYQETLNYYHKL